MTTLALLLLAPDITKTMILAQKTVIVNGLPNNNLQSDKSSAIADNAFNLTMLQCSSESPYSHLSCSSESSSSPKKMLISSQQDASSRPQSSCCSTGNQRDLMNSSCQLPGNVDKESAAWARFTAAGGRLNLPESGDLSRLVV